MLLVGLTGNIASGKSTVADMLAGLGATIVDADTLARTAVEPGTPAFAQIVDRWGRAVVTDDGSLDRAALRRIVFANRGELEHLNAIVHPHVERLRHERVMAARERGDRIVICDIPLLFERNLQSSFDCIVLVDAPRTLRRERLIRERALEPGEADDMLSAQMPAELKRAHADIVIENDGTLSELERQVSQAWTTLSRLERRRATEA